MDQRPRRRIQHAHYGKRNGKKINAHGKQYAELDCMDCGVGQPLKIRNIGKVIIHQSNISRFNGNVASHAAHGGADVRTF